MRDRWYGDNHDLVKWGILLKLANLYHASKIVQVAYYRPETIKIDSIAEEEAKELGADPGWSCIYQMPDAVTNHFSRSLMEITRLSSSSVQIQVVNSVWSAEGRASCAYVQKVKAELEKLPIDSPCIIFLDPDTGLEPPNGKPELEHVLESELEQIWEKAVRVNDVLVFYQHKAGRKKGESWIKPKKEQFESALHLCNGAAKLACNGGARLAGGKAATDVVFFFAQKPDAHRDKFSDVAPARDQTKTIKKMCPECDHLFKGNGFEGIDRHWRAKHEDDIMPFEKAWPLIKSGKYQPVEMSGRTASRPRSARS